MLFKIFVEFNSISGGGGGGGGRLSPKINRSLATGDPYPDSSSLLHQKG